MRLVNFQFYSSILTFLLLAHVQALYVKPHLERTHSNNLTFINCRSRTNSLINQYSSLILNLQPALRDLSAPSASPAFTAFFKDPNHAPFIRRILQNITTAAPTPAISDRAISPSFVCLDGPTQVNSTEYDTDMYIRCQDPHGPFATTLLESPAEPVITLCPRFFHLPVRLQRSKRACLEVGVQGKLFLSDGLDLIRHQSWVLMHELAHIYLWNTLGSRMDYYNVEQCLSLPSKRTVGNAESYVYYVANVRLGCTLFPSRPHPPRRGIPHHRGPANATVFDSEVQWG
ncbi:hypothetical protein XPA_010713 [Xanthoria parietina]